MEKLLVNFTGLFDNKNHAIQILEQLKQDLQNDDANDYGYQYKYFSVLVPTTKKTQLDDYIRVEMQIDPSLPDDVEGYEGDK